MQIVNNKLHNASTDTSYIKHTLKRATPDTVAIIN